MFFEVIPTAVFRENGNILTYQSHLPLQPGQIVLIPLGRKKVVGIVWRQVAKVDFPTKAIIEVIRSEILPPHLLKAIFWLSEYYLSPLPACANLVIPAGLTARTVTKPTDNLEPTNSPNSPDHPLPTSEMPKNTILSSTTEIKLNQYQRNAMRAIQQAPGSTRLLRGVTGSGKTNIYLKMASTALSEQKSTILLVPEIALTSQLVRIFEQIFGDRVILIHSQQTMAERRKIWLKILKTTSQGSTNSRYYSEGVSPSFRESSPRKKSASCGAGTQSFVETIRSATSEEEAASARNDGPEERRVSKDSERQPRAMPLIIIGPRSALLTPVANLGLIIIDEAHEGAYYQENAPRYSALRLASFIAKTLQIPCIEGSATPNIVDYHLAKTHHALIELTEKAKSTALEPEISVIDLKDRNNFAKNRYFSNQLLTAIDKSLKAKHQILIFHNRRGSSPLTICENCGWQALCPNCYLPMTLDADNYQLSCHICGHQAKVPSSCPECGQTGIIHKGFGTKLLETELGKLFPQAKIARFDGDNKKTDNFAALYQSVHNGEIDILIGTQTLARGLDLPHLATVGIVQADTGLSLPDFAAEERTFELLNQVIGRVGRGHLDQAEVLIQTYQPDHPVIQTAIKSDFEAFAKYLLHKRRAQALPPFTYIARLTITYKTEKTTLAKIQQAYSRLKRNPKLIVSPPLPAFHERTRRGFTWQIFVKSTSRSQLLEALAPYKQFHLEFDPPSLL